jgi:hypothetical protein
MLPTSDILICIGSAFRTIFFGTALVFPAAGVLRSHGNHRAIVPPVLV